MPKLRGIFPAMITPFTSDEEIDEKSTRRMIDYLIENGVQGIVCCGSTGESGALSREERRRVIELTVDQVNKRGPVIAGTGTSGTKTTVDLTKDAKEAGVDAALIITPFYLIPTDEGLYEHYKTVAESVDIPIIIYNVPQATMVNLAPPLLARFVREFRNIVGIKESSGNTAQLAEYIRLVGDEVAVMTGNDAALYPDFELGCAGAIIAIGNVAPKMAVEIFTAVQNGDTKRAREVYNQLLPLAIALDGEQNWAARVKELVTLQGLPAGHVRKPYVPSKPEEVNALREALKVARLI